MRCLRGRRRLLFDNAVSAPSKYQPSVVVAHSPKNADPITIGDRYSRAALRVVTTLRMQAARGCWLTQARMRSERAVGFETGHE